MPVNLGIEWGWGNGGVAWPRLLISPHPSVLFMLSSFTAKTTLEKSAERRAVSGEK